MKRRGFLEPLPKARRVRTLLASSSQSWGQSETREDTRIWEEQKAEAEDLAATAAAIVEDDVEPLSDDSRILNTLNLNLVSIHFGNPSVEDDNDGDGDDNDGDGDDNDGDEGDKDHDEANVGVEGKVTTCIGGNAPAEEEMLIIDGEVAETLNTSKGIEIDDAALDPSIPSISITNKPDPPRDVAEPPDAYRNRTPIPDSEVDDDEVVVDGPNDKYRNTCGEDFHLAMMLFATSADLSVSQYQALREVLALATIETLQSLPKSLKTLRERCRKSFPLLNIKGKLVDIQLQSVPPKKETPRYAYYFNPSEYCQLWLSSPSTRASIHQGMGEFTDVAVELWHGDIWMESVRSTSGKFPYILERESHQHNRVVLLPSDCVMYEDATGDLALGRVKCVGIDRRGTSPTQGHECALVNRLVPPGLLPAAWLNQWNGRVQQPEDDYPLSNSALPELVLVEASQEIISCTNIKSRVWVHFTDYASIDELQTSLLPLEPTFCVRYIAYEYGGQRGIRSVHKRHRVLAEIELQELTREYVLTSLVSIPPLNPSIIPLRRVSIPYSIFLDGFGLYRNAYYSLKGMYLTPAGMDVYNRTRLHNLYVLMIGPFGSDEDQMAGCLKMDALPIGRGCCITLDSGEQVFVTAFPLLFTGDMPQQNLNSGNKTHKAEFGCRSCFVKEDERHKLDYNIVDLGRYRQHIQFLYKGAMSLHTKAARDKSLQKLGLSAGGPYFNECFTMMDPQRSTPNDPMHAELRLCKYFAEALLEGILSAEGLKAYRAAWNDVEVPYKWGQPQNPVTHKGSMVFNEHGKVATINPFVLMHMFSNNDWAYHKGVKRKDLSQIRNSYIKKGVDSRLRREFVDDIKEWPAGGCAGGIIKAAWCLSRCVCLTLQESLSTVERKAFKHVVVSMRSSLQKIFACASAEKKTFKNYANVPNIHLALHYLNDIENYGTARNSTTMMGEQKHKVFKVHAPHTNSKDADLQLMKTTNTLQTVRFVLDGAFQTSAPELTQQLQEMVVKCPTLHTRFLGARLFGEERSEQVERSRFDIDISQALFGNARTGRPLTLKSISTSDLSSDTGVLRSVYHQEYGISLHPSTQLKVRYWGYFAGDPETEGALKSPRFNVKLKNFIRLRGEEHFHCVNRILTVTVDTTTRVFFVLDRLLRDPSQETPLAPYQVYRVSETEPTVGDAGAPAADTTIPPTCIHVGIRKIDPTILHFVKKKGNSWWYNPYIPYFL